MRLGSAAGIPVSIEFLWKSRYRGTVIGDRLVRGRHLARVHQIQTYALQALAPELECLSGSIGQVNNPARNHRTAVIDPHNHGLAIAQVRDFHVASHGKLQVGSSHVVLLVGFAAGRGLTLKGLPIPGSGPHLIRLGFDLFAGFGSDLNRTTWSRFRLRDVRSLSRSQADDQKSNRQSMSYTSSHSVLLAYSKVTLALRLFPAVPRCYRRAKGVSRRNEGFQDDLLVIEIKVTCLKCNDMRITAFVSRSLGIYQMVNGPLEAGR